MSSGLFTPSRTPTEYALSINTSSPNEVVTISIGGSDDGLFWAGCYGPSVFDAGLFAMPLTPSIPQNSLWIELPENWTQNVAAPEGSTFTNVLFASYGTPEGSSGNYVRGWCHSDLSESVVSDLALGNNSFELASSNSIFGDPCGGTYKRLFVLLEYSVVVPSTTTTTTTSTTSTTSTTTTTIPQTTVPLVVIEPATTTNPPTTTTTVPVTTTTRVITSAPTETAIPKPTPVTENEEEAPTTPSEEVKPLEEMTQQEIIAEVDKIIDNGISEEKAVELATNPQVVASLTSEQAEEVFAALDVSALSDEEAEQLVAAVQNAPESVRKALENNVNVFGGKLDSYVPVGSAISVAERRVVVAAAAALAAAPIAATTRKV